MTLVAGQASTDVRYAQRAMSDGRALSTTTPSGSGDGPSALRLGKRSSMARTSSALDVGAEQLAARLEAYALGQRAGDDRIEAERVDEGGDRVTVGGVVAGDRDGLAAGRPGRPGLVLEVVVAHVVERLDDARAGQERLDDLARRGARVGEVVADAVDLPPVVHGVDDELAAQRVGGNAAVLAQRQGEDDDVGVGRRRRPAVVATAPGREHLDGEGDLRRVAGAGDQHPVAGGDGEPGEHGAHLAGAEDAEGRGRLRSLSFMSSSRVEC